MMCNYMYDVKLEREIFHFLWTWRQHNSTFWSAHSSGFQARKTSCQAVITSQLVVIVWWRILNRCCFFTSNIRRYFHLLLGVHIHDVVKSHLVTHLLIQISKHIFLVLEGNVCAFYFVELTVTTSFGLAVGRILYFCNIGHEMTWRGSNFTCG